MTQTLHLDRVRPSPITQRPVLKDGRWLDTGSGRFCPAGGDTWYNGPPGTPNKRMPFQVQIEAAKAHGWNAVMRDWTWSSAGRDADPGVDWSPLPWARRGDGRFDLNRFDPQYFVGIEERADACLAENLLFGMMALQGHFDINTHPLNPAMNVQGIDGGDHPFSNPTGAGWQVIRSYLVHLSRVLAGHINVFAEIKNEGEWSADFHRDCARILQGEGLLVVASSGINGPSPDGLKASGADIVAIGWNGNRETILEEGYPVEEWSEAESIEAGRRYLPEINNFPQIGAGDHNNVALTSRSEQVLISLGMTSFLRGLWWDHMAVYPGYQLSGWESKPWNDPNNPAQKGGSRVAGQIHAWSRRMRLGQMEPQDDVGTGVAMLARDGLEQAHWIWDEPRITVATNHRVKTEWFNVMNDRIVEDVSIPPGAKTLTPPFHPALLYLHSPEIESAFPEEWLTGGGGEPPPPSGDGDGTVRAARAGKKIDSWLDLPTKQARKREIQKLKKARRDLKVAIERAGD